MTTDTATSLSELSAKLDRFRADLENLQRELEQSLQSWRASLVGERKDFQTLLQNQQAEWDAKERQWQEQRGAYDRQIGELDAHFRAQLGTAEQNALRALNELDDSWQRDKLKWNQGVAERIQELEGRQALWASERDKQAAFLNDLESQVSNFKEVVTDSLADRNSDEHNWAQERETLLRDLQE
ncbi:MAG TPA: hypothetical protein VMU17_00010, partial [Elusimicrobiota bacterium]|nr:hypothetical protein [Elusimicrobiota bacterium]